MLSLTTFLDEAGFQKKVSKLFIMKFGPRLTSVFDTFVLSLKTYFKRGWSSPIFCWVNSTPWDNPIMRFELE